MQRWNKEWYYSGAKGDNPVGDLRHQNNTGYPKGQPVRFI
jgi:hypothetical protein